MFVVSSFEEWIPIPWETKDSSAYYMWQKSMDSQAQKS